MTDQKILLETGTNEVEVLEFYLGKQSFGVNVLKVRRLLKYEQKSTTAVPDIHASIMGSFIYQGFSTTLIDLNKHLKRREDRTERRQIILICEFNNALNGFLVDGVNRIHRLSWKYIQSAPVVIEQSQPRVTGVAHIEGREVMMLDFENVIGDIVGNFDSVPPLELQTVQKPDLMKARQAVKVFIAEDSWMYQEWLVEQLKSVDYHSVTAFNNGAELYNAVISLQNQAAGKDNLRQMVDIVVADIEMPQMDGLTLCKKLKEKFPHLPVLILSSLASEELALQCESVAADGYFTKKQFPGLFTRMDQLVLLDKGINEEFVK